MNAINTFFNFFERYNEYLSKNANKFKVSVSDRETVYAISVKWDYTTVNGEGFITAELVFDEELNDYFIDIEEFFLDKDLIEYEYMETYSIDDDIELSKVSMII